jgi:hypothetical protein
MSWDARQEAMAMTWRKRSRQARLLLATPNQGKKTSNLEAFQVVVGIIVSIATATIGWKTFQLDERAKENNVQLKNIEQQLAETKFGFERVRDIYDRTEKYLAAEKQDERRGRALVVLIGSLPDLSLRNELLSIVVREATSSSVAAKAADTQQGKSPSTDPVIAPKVDPNNFFGSTKFRLKEDGYAVETLEKFGFKDSKGVTWEVPAGQIISGDAVPRALWSVVGAPLSSDMIASNALLEYYSSQRTRPPEQVAQMYYESLLKSGVSDAKAKVLTRAFSAFGPKWNNSKP